jgi:type IX secretion system PorP/SprF family membrane protein
MARFALLLLLAAPGATAHAQQDPLYSQYMFNTLAFNPGYAGSGDVFTAMALSRHQWVGFAGAPSTQTLLMHTPLRNHNVGLGFTLMNDRIGPTDQLGVYGDFAYRIRTGEDTRLAFGLKAGMNVYQADVAALATVENDPANANIRGQLLPNFGFGLFWHSDRYYLGLSIPKLLTNQIDAVADNVVVTAEEARHYFLIGGYVFDLNMDLKFRPSFMVRAVQGAPLSMDLNANFLLRERVWFGAMYRIGNSAGLLAQYQINDQLRCGYAFDLTTNRLGAYNAGTHEVMISYDLQFIRGRTVSPRYF